LTSKFDSSADLTGEAVELMVGQDSLSFEATAMEKLLQRSKGRAPGRARERRFANTNPSPRVARPNSVGASGPRELAEREMDAPKVSRSVMMRRVAREGSSLGSTRRKRNRKEELAKPEVRNDKQGFAGHHASEVRIVEGDRIDDGLKLLGS
jgi:hypothetical protein